MTAHPAPKPRLNPRLDDYTMQASKNLAAPSRQPDWQADVRAYRQHIGRWLMAYQHGALATQWATLADLAAAFLQWMVDPDTTRPEPSQ